MATLTINKSDLTLWQGGTGSIIINVNEPALTQPFQPGTGALVNVDFKVTGSDPLTFGNVGSATIGITAETTAKLNVFFPGATDSVLTSTGEARYLKDGKLVMALQLGADAAVNASVKVPYADLTLTGTLDTGADAGYTYLKPFDASRACGGILMEFLGGMRLPGSALTALVPGEIISFEQGGYLNLGASVSVGYQMQGTASIDWGKLALSEAYGLSVMGGIDFSAKVAGRFHIDVKGIDAPTGMPAGSNWVNVTVRRAHTSQVGVAADVKAEFTSQLNGLPGSGLELIGAITGVNSKNWFNYLVQLSKAQSLDDVNKATDTLAWWYLGKLLNKTFDQIHADVQPVLDTIKKIVTAYQSFDTHAINLFDRYYDKVVQAVQPALESIGKLVSWDDLLGKNIPEDLANAIGALTAADPQRPLSWVVAQLNQAEGDGLKALQDAAAKLLSQIQQGAHQEILSVIKTAKESFGIDDLMNQLSQFTSADALKQKANTLIGGFVSRLIGKVLAGLTSDADFQAAWKKLQPIIGKAQQIETQVWSAFQDAVNSTYSASLHLEYSRATEDDRLIDARFNLNSLKGRSLFLRACQGDFGDLLTAINSPQPAADPHPVLLNEAVFTHKITKTSAFKINVIGWHNRFQYENSGIDQVATAVQQHVQVNDNGTITLDTTADLSQERKRVSGLSGHQETVDTIFLVHFAAASVGALQVDPETKEYLTDYVSAVSANYDLTLRKQAATRRVVDYYLGFASSFGISLNAMAPDQIADLLPHTGDNFGTVTAAYAINFTPEAVKGAFARNITPEMLRSIMRQIVLVSYARDGAGSTLCDIGRAYATDALYQQWKTLGFAEFSNKSNWAVRGAAFVPNLPGQDPGDTEVDITNGSMGGFNQVAIVSTLYSIEDSLVDAFLALQGLMFPGPAGPVPVSPDQLTKRLQAFGDALGAFDDFSAGPANAVNPVFAVFDQLARLGTTDPATRTATLNLTADSGGTRVSQIYASPRAHAASV
jgi:hypothetical protein